MKQSTRRIRYGREKKKGLNKIQRNVKCDHDKSSYYLIVTKVKHMALARFRKEKTNKLRSGCNVILTKAQSYLLAFVK